MHKYFQQTVLYLKHPIVFEQFRKLIINNIKKETFSLTICVSLLIRRFPCGILCLYSVTYTAAQTHCTLPSPETPQSKLVNTQSVASTRNASPVARQRCVHQKHSSRPTAWAGRTLNIALFITTTQKSSQEIKKRYVDFKSLKFFYLLLQYAHEALRNYKIIPVKIEELDGRSMWHVWGIRGAWRNLEKKNLGERCQLEDLGVNGRIVLERIFNK